MIRATDCGTGVPNRRRASPVRRARFLRSASAQSVPKRLKTIPFSQADGRPEPEELSHVPPGRTTGRQRPSNFWGVGYRLLGE
jgi:hypothetical protein